MGYFWFGLCLQFAHALKRDKLWQSNEIPCKPVLIRTGYVVIPPTVHKQMAYTPRMGIVLSLQSTDRIVGVYLVM